MTISDRKWICKLIFACMNTLGSLINSKLWYAVIAKEFKDHLAELEREA